MRSKRGWGVRGIAAFSASLLLATWSRAELVDVDSTWPSVGPASVGPHPEPDWVDIPIAPGEAPVVEPSRPARGEESAAEPAELGGPGTPAVALGFAGVDGTSKDGFLYKPPDTHLAVGTGSGTAGRVVMVTNSGVQVWNKSGSSLAGPTPLDTFLGTPTATSFDPKVLFDQHSGRFFIVALRGSTPNPAGTSNVHIAVSTSSTPGNLTSDWTKLSGSALTTIGAIETWFDYPSIGADAGSLFVTGNMFDAADTFRGVKIRVFNKSSLLAGSYSFVDLNVDAATTSGVFTVQPAHVYGTTDSGHFYLVNRVGSTTYRLWEVSGAPSAPTIVGNAARTWSAGSQITAGAPQSGTSVTLDTLSSRIINAVYRGGSVWLALGSDTDADSKTEVFWAKIATNGGLPSAPTIADSGSVDGSDGVEWTFLPSINVNSGGAATIVYTQTYSDQFPDMRYVSRASADPAGTFQSSVVASSSTQYYDDFGSDSLERWGDYSATVVDPADDSTFWVAHEVVSSLAPDVNGRRWATFIAKLGAVLPAPTATATRTSTATATPTRTPTVTASVTVTPTRTPTPSVTASVTPLPTFTRTATRTRTPTVTPTNAPGTCTSSSQCSTGCCLKPLASLPGVCVPPVGGCAP